MIHKSDRKLKVGVIQHFFSDDIDTNRSRNLAAIQNLADEGAELIVLSELHDSLYFCQTENVDNFSLAVDIPGDFTDFYAEAARQNGVVLRGYITIRLWSSRGMDLLQGNTARCISRMIQDFMKSSISLLVIWDSSL